MFALSLALVGGVKPPTKRQKTTREGGGGGIPPPIESLPDDIVRELCAKDLSHDEVRALACANRYHADAYRKMKTLPGVRSHLMAKAPFEITASRVQPYNWVTGIAIDVDTIVTTYANRTMKIQDRASGDLRHTIKAYISGRGVVVAMGAGVIVTGGGGDNEDEDDDEGWEENTVKVWNKYTGELVHTLAGHTDWINSVAVDSDVIVSGAAQIIKVWDMSTGDLMRTIDAREQDDFETVYAVAMDSDIIASGGIFGKIKIWDRRTGDHIQTLIPPLSYYYPIHSIAIDANIIVAGLHNHTMQVYDKNTWELIRVLRGHTKQIDVVAIDGNHIVSGSSDKTVKVWDKDTGELIDTLEHPDWVTSVVISGSEIISGSTDGIRVWQRTI